jgi:hypothetical protein
VLEVLLVEEFHQDLQQSEHPKKLWSNRFFELGNIQLYIQNVENGWPQVEVNKPRLFISWKK